MRSATATDWEEPVGSAAVPAAPVAGLPGLADFGRAAGFLRAEAPRIGASTAVGLVLALGLWSAMPASWTASALVMVDPRTAKVTTADEVLPGIGADSAAIASIAEIATSDGVLAGLVRSEKLAEDPEFGAGGADETDMIGRLRKAVKVNRRGLTYVIEISATTRDAERSARIANAVAKDMVDRQSATRVNASTGAAGALEKRLADLRAAALASEKAVSDYRVGHGLVDVAADSTVGQRRLASLTQQAAAVRTRLEEARARWDELRRMKPQDVGGAAMPRSELLVSLRSQFAEETRTAAEQARIYGPRHPKVETSQERLATLEQQIRAETTRLIDQAKSEVETLTRQNAGLESELAKRTDAELAMNQDEVVLRDLIRQADADRQIYEQFLARQKSAHEQSGLTRPETEVASAATPPTRSNKPSPVLVAPVGGFVGALAGIAFAWSRRRRTEPAAPLVAETEARPDWHADWEEPAWERRGETIHRADDPPIYGASDGATASPPPPVAAAAGPVAIDPEVLFEELGTPVVADLPRLDAAPALADGSAPAEPGEIDLAVADARPAMMPFAEIFFPHLKTNPGQALMVTNVPGAVGRTTMALAIARMAEAVGLTALVVTDHGAAHDLSPSLADVLAGRHDLAALPPPETVDRVSVMGFGGEGDDGFWDLADDGRLPALMARLTRHWDLVVVESAAPEEENRDALPSTDAFRAVLLVADRDRNTLDDVAETAALWADDGDRLVMIGLNHAA
mgnify:CR=1 FL=1